MDEIERLHELKMVILRLSAESKAPQGKGWTVQPAASLTEIREHQRAGGNLGLQTGKRSRVGHGDCLVGFDLDLEMRDQADKNAALATVRNILGDFKQFPTVISGSRSGSAHFYAKCPIAQLPRSQRLVKYPTWSLSLYGDGTQLVLPPSVHPRTKREYLWLRKFSDVALPDITQLKVWDLIQAKVDTQVGDDMRHVTTDDTDLSQISISPHMRQLIEFGDVEDKYPSRSEAVYAAVHALVRAGVSDDSVGLILTDPQNALSAAALDRRGGDADSAIGWLLPQIKKAAGVQLAALQEEFQAANPAPVIRQPLGLIEPSKIPLTPWIIPGRFAAGMITVTAGFGGAGKSLLSIQEAISIATGKDLGLGKVVEPGHVWLYSGEDLVVEVHRRIAAIAKHYNIPLSLLAKTMSLNAGTRRENRLQIAKTGEYGKKTICWDVLEMMADEITRTEVKLLIIDPFVRCHQLNENDNADMDLVVDALAWLAEQTKCAINIVHHAKKLGSAETMAGNADAIRGASAIVNAARVAHTLTTMSVKEAETLGIPAERRVYYCRFDNAKANYFIDPSGAHWFEKVSVDLLNCIEKPELSDRRGVLVPWQTPDNILPGVTTLQADQALRAIQNGQYGMQRKGENCVHNLLKCHPFNLPKTTTDQLLEFWIDNGILVEIEGKDDRRRSMKYLKVIG